VPAAHAHDKPGSHGGLISPIGTENYHVEAVFEKEGIVKLYVLGKDEARVQEVESQSLEAYVKPMDGMEATQVDFQAVPQKGDTQGKTSRFIGKLPPELRGKAVTGTVPSITISGERFRFSFASGQSHEDPMPQQVSAEQARELYLTPGGKYTQADIEANGTMTAPQKYEGFRASHNIKPSKGDKVCPVTLTKANPKCTWIVGGNTYEF